MDFDQFFSKQVPGLTISYNDVFEIFSNNGIDVYINGGVIRDILCMKFEKVMDVDFSFTGTIENLVEIARNNFWQYSKRPDFPVIQIGDRKGCCLQGISTEYTIHAPIESIDFCINHIIYHFNTKKIIDRTGKGFNAVLNKRLDIPIDDKEKWFLCEVVGFVYGKIFRGWKMLGRGFLMEYSLQSFLCSKTNVCFMENETQFLKYMCIYLGRDYDDYESYKKGCMLIMGEEWVSQVIISNKNEIINCFYDKENLWNKYTFNR